MVGPVMMVVISVLLSGVCLWIGGKLTGVDASFQDMLVIALAASLAGLVPTIGAILYIIVMFVLLCKWTGADFWPDAVLQVVAATVVSHLGLAAVAGMVA